MDTPPHDGLALLAEPAPLKTEQVETLERISGFTTDQAKEHLLSLLDSELTHEKAVKITAYEQKLKDEEDEIARKHISLAISRLAADTVSESAVSVVAIPNDENEGPYHRPRGTQYPRP